MQGTPGFVATVPSFLMTQFCLILLTETGTNVPGRNSDLKRLNGLSKMTPEVEKLGSKARSFFSQKCVLLANETSKHPGDILVLSPPVARWPSKVAGKLRTVISL